MWTEVIIPIGPFAMGAAASELMHRRADVLRDESPVIPEST